MYGWNIELVCEKILIYRLILDFRKHKNTKAHIPLALKAMTSYMTCSFWKSPLYSCTRMKVKEEILSSYCYGISSGLAKPLNLPWVPRPHFENCCSAGKKAGAPEHIKLNYETVLTNLSFHIFSLTKNLKFKLHLY